MLDDDAFGICVGGCAVQAVLVQVEHDDLRVLVLVEAVSVRDLLGHIVLVPTRLLDHVSEHLVDSVGLRGFFGLDLFEQSFDLSVLLLVLSEQFLRSLAVVSALVSIVLHLQLFDLGAFGFQEPLTGGHELLELSLPRLLHLSLLF